MAVLYFYLNIAYVRSKGVDIIEIYFSLELLSRECVSMGAVGAMAPMNFQKDVFGTHETLKSMYSVTICLIDWHPGNFLVTIEWHPCSQIPNAPSVGARFIRIPE